MQGELWLNPMELALAVTDSPLGFCRMGVSLLFFLVGLSGRSKSMKISLKMITIIHHVVVHI